MGHCENHQLAYAAGSDWQYSEFQGTASLMLQVVESGCKQHVVTDAAADPSTSVSVDLSPWPAPSYRDWCNVVIIALNTASLLSWVHYPTTEDQELAAIGNTSHSLVSEAAEIGPSQYLLMQTLLQILDKLLTGKCLVPGNSSVRLQLSIQ